MGIFFAYKVNFNKIDEKKKVYDFIVDLKNEN